MPGITAVVCTYNRAHSLRDTLQSLADQLPHGRHPLEILVVDNNCTDHTAQVVAEAQQRSPWKVLRVVEPNQGIAFARNRGLREAAGDYVAFIDDDAVAMQDWARELVNCLEESAADLVGGRITALWTVERPQWLSADLSGCVIAQDYGNQRKPCHGELFLTTNIAFRRAALDRYGLFDTRLGRRGKSLVGGEDFELCRRWLAGGARVFYEPAAVVQHKVEAERISPDFLRRWYRDTALTQAYQEDWQPRYRWMIVPVWRWIKLIKAALAYGITRPSRSIREELWWIYHRYHFLERVDHWKAYWLKQNPPRTRFVTAFEEQR
jgi:glycosyltransferase involved in cell wall biosynthesis